MSGTSNVKHASTVAGDVMPPATVKTSAVAKRRSKKDRFYKPLPREFRRDGFIYRQIYREGNSAIYRQTWKGNDDSAAFEVIRLRYRDEFWICGKFVEAYEVYPSSTSWGVDGFTLTDRDAAFAKLRELA